MAFILLRFLDGDDHAYNLLASDSSELWQLGIGYIEIADNVYNDTRGLHDTTSSGAGRSLILKYSRLFDLID